MAAIDPGSYDYREVACPVCHARAGAYCKRPSGHAGPFVQPHQPRRTAAHRLWRAEELRRYGRQLTSWGDDEPAQGQPQAPVVVGGQLSLFAQ